MTTPAFRVRGLAIAFTLASLSVGLAQERPAPRLWSNHGMWLANYNQGVAEELGLTPQQKSAASFAYGSTRQRPDQAQGAVDRFIGMLSDQQLERLNQITLQNFGANSLEMANVATALSLTDDQKAKITAVRAEVLKKRHEMMSASDITLQQGEDLKKSQRERLAEAVKELSLTEEQEKKLAAILQRSDTAAMQILGHTKPPAAEAVAALRTETLEKATQVLTDAQREQFKKMLGTPVKYKFRGDGG